MKQPDLKTYSKDIIEVDGLLFKDLNSNGKLDPYEDWRLSSEERADDLVKQMNLDEKVGMMLINSLLMAKAHPEIDVEGALINVTTPKDPKDMFSGIPATNELIQKRQMRHFIAREILSMENTVEWMNELNKLAEDSRLGIPVLVTSNSRNEQTDLGSFSVNDGKDEGAYSTYPGTLGLSAAVKGDLAKGGDYTLIKQFADNSRKEWNATGIRKGYMYMIDVVTDPRWQRIDQTFGEDPIFIAEMAGHIIDGFQGDKVHDESVAMTMQPFPGGGARENGFDPHYVEGKWNIYRTEGSLEKYHLPPFVEAAKHNPASMMPYYSAPSIEKSHYQEYDGKLVRFEEVGFAFNDYIMNDLLRDQLGFTGYVNSDTGIVGDMDWGVEDLSVPGKFAKAVNAGTNIIAGSYEVAQLKEAVTNKWIPEARINLSNKRLLMEMFDLGLFDDKTYVDTKESQEVLKDEKRHELAYEAHLKSVTLLKNDSLLPIENKKVYIEAFHKDPELADKYTDKSIKAAQELNMDVVYNHNEADVAILFVYPVSGSYFSATPGLLELELCENKENIAMNGDSYTETTVTNLNRFYEIANDVKANNGKVVTTVNISLPWILGKVEEVSDVLLAGYYTSEKAVLDVVIGNFKPQGKLPITLPKNAQVIAVDEFGKSVSRNDVPGYDKHKYMREGMTYAYQDATGNEYKLGFGLTY